jgi:Rieske 2Fe-2S family protein
MSQFVKAAEIFRTGPAGPKTLPGSFYTSPEIFEQEQSRIFQTRWLCAGREEQIPAAGDFFVRTLGAESVLVVRNRSGTICAFHNICRHRGARLCEAPQGTLRSTIQCAYHAWTYALDGRLLAAPSMDDLAGFDKGDYPLHSVPLATWKGFVYISLAEKPQSFDEAYAAILHKFARYNLSRLKAARRIDYDVRANWKLVFQNYSECYHCGLVHPTLSKLSPADSGENDLVSGPFLGGFMTVNPDRGSLTLSGRACAMPVGDLPQADLHRVYYYSIFPNMLLSLHPDYVMVHTIWPVAANRTRIECEWLFHPDAAAQPGFNPEDAVGLWDRTNREDWHVCELSQQGVASRAYTPGPYSPREGVLVAFDRELLKSLGMDGQS